MFICRGEFGVEFALCRTYALIGSPSANRTSSVPCTSRVALGVIPVLGFSSVFIF
jgi:hypothetical protein